MVSWNLCIKQREVKEITPDEEMVQSLIKTSANKTFSADALELREETAAAKISLSYDSVRELLEAVSLNKGFKIYNHVCYTAFVKEVLKKEELAEEFDELRLIRNDINYYGKDVSVSESKQIIHRLQTLRNKILDLLY